MTDEIRAKYEGVFKKKGHIAKPILINDDFWIVDWKKKEGGSDYAVRYILDLKKGNLIITGDLGDCVASWYNAVTPKRMAGYVDSIDYFIGKMQATSDKYRYEWQDIKDDLQDIKKHYLDNLDDYDIYEDMDDGERRAQIEEDFDDLQSILDEINLNEHTTFPRDYAEIAEKYNTDWWESDFRDVGKRINPRVYLWAVGFQMAYRRISGEVANE